MQDMRCAQATLLYPTLAKSATFIFFFSLDKTDVVFLHAILPFSDLKGGKFGRLIPLLCLTIPLTPVFGASLDWM